MTCSVASLEMYVILACKFQCSNKKCTLFLIKVLWCFFLLAVCLSHQQSYWAMKTRCPLHLLPLLVHRQEQVAFIAPHSPRQARKMQHQAEKSRLASCRCLHVVCQCSLNRDFKVFLNSGINFGITFNKETGSLPTHPIPSTNLMSFDTVLPCSLLHG